MSRHHILPPIVYTSAPPKPKETRRKRNVASAQAKREIDASEETEEASEAAHTAAARAAQNRPHDAPIEAADRRIPSPNGKLSDGTLKAMLEMQEKGER